jgi:hypothetical protein
MLGVEPEELSAQRWKSFAHHWPSYNEASMPTQAHCFHLNEVFPNRIDEDEIYLLTKVEIAAAQWAGASLKHLFKRNAVIDQGLEIKLNENTTCVCKDGWLVIPKPLQVRAVKWYHQYLQHPGHTRLEETMNAAMYWKGMRTTIRSLTKSCRSYKLIRDGHENMGTSHQRLSIQSLGNVYVLTSLVHTLLKAKITCR